MVVAAFSEGGLVTTLLLTAFCIITFATAAHAMTGFGFALVGVPLLTFALDPRTAVVAITAVDLVLTIMIVIRERSHIQWRSAGVVTLASLIGIPVGIYVLATFSEDLLTVLIALVVLVFAALLALGFRVSRGNRTEVAAGVSSGILLAATGMNGPPLVAAFQAMQLSPRTFRATLQAVFAFQAVIVVAGFAVTGQFDELSVTVSAVALPALVLGWLIGDKVFHRLSGPQFRRLVLGTMVVSAILALVSAFAR